MKLRVSNLGFRAFGLLENQQFILPQPFQVAMKEKSGQKTAIIVGMLIETARDATNVVYWKADERVFCQAPASVE